MFKPLLIGSTLVGALGAQLLQAELAPAPQFQPLQADQAPAGAPQRAASGAQLPAWIEQRRAELDATRAAEPPAPPVAPQPPAAPGMPVEAPVAAQGRALPEWVQENRFMPAPPQPPKMADDAPTEPALPEWVKQQRGDFAATRPPRTEEPPQTDMERPAAPAWVIEQHSRVARPATPKAPEMPNMHDIPAAPEIPVWVEEQQAIMSSPPRFADPLEPETSEDDEETAGVAPAAPYFNRPPAPAYRPWGGVPYGGWGRPYGGWGNNGWGNSWMPWGNSGWGNNGWGDSWMPWGGGGWGDDWMPWGNGWGNNGWGGDGWNNSYNSGWGDGYGDTRGDAAGDAEADLKFDLMMRGRVDMRGEGYGDGSGYGDGWGRGYNYRGYGPYLPPPMPMPMPMQPAEPEGPDDGDDDGVADGSDLCPDTEEGVEVDALGCGDAARIVLRGVNFKTDSAELTDESLAILDGVSETLSAHPEIKVMVAGHTDSDGEDAYNKDLSQRRAQSVVDYLAANGVDHNNMIAKGFGEEQPVADNDTAEGKAENRRVELNRL